ncbi:MAG: acyl-CoA dehydrogenase family protein [Actinomycetota bacterium]|nr:acyl-CoA dehydrogenase family protein [Actinomycetota bacterium]
MSSLGTDYFFLDDLLTEEERDVRDRVRFFCEKELIPIINDYWEREDFPFELLPKIAALNIAGTTIKGYGCPKMSATAAGLVSRELARGDGGLTTFFAVHSGVAMTSIATLGSEEQKERWLPPMARMEKIGAFGLTEPQHGSDAGLLETTARREGNEYVIDGEKRWIGNASFADVTVIWAREENDKLAAFLVEKGTPGLKATVITGKASQRTVLNTDLKLDGVRVLAENRLANSRGFGDAVQVLTPTRHNVAWEAVGHAVAAYEVALTYAKERVQFGKPIASFQLIQGKLAKMLADITAMQTLCFRLSQLRAEGRMTIAMASLAKMHNAKRAYQVVADARDILGGNGVLLEYHVARHLADMQAVYTYDGTDSVLALIVGRDITGYQAFS